MSLGTLKKIDLREAWKHEANDFTQWLALEENLSLLADAIGFDLKLVHHLFPLRVCGLIQVSFI